MQRKFFLFLVLIFVSFGVSNLTTHVAHAGGYYIRRIPAHDGWCNRNGFSTHGTFSWSVPPGDVYVHSVSYMNGVMFADETWLSGLSGTGSTVSTFFSPASYPFPQTIPYTLNIQQEWKTATSGIFARTFTTLTCISASSVPRVLQYSTP
jgi:hypothetical protein